MKHSGNASFPLKKKCTRVETFIVDYVAIIGFELVSSVVSGIINEEIWGVHLGFN